MINHLDPIDDIHSKGIDIRNREIYLHTYGGDTTEEDPGVDWRMANALLKNIRTLDNQNNNNIIIHMHSIGGDWGPGMAIFDAIKMTQSYVTAVAYAQAESMSSIILQAADKRIMCPNAYFMLHFGKDTYGGNHLDVVNSMEQNKKFTDTMLNIYAEVAVKGKYCKERNLTTIPKVKSFLKRKMKDGDWYLNAEETVYHGFADGILGQGKFKDIDSLK